MQNVIKMEGTLLDPFLLLKIQMIKKNKMCQRIRYMNFIQDHEKKKKKKKENKRQKETHQIVSIPNKYDNQASRCEPSSTRQVLGGSLI